MKRIITITLLVVAACASAPAQVTSKTALRIQSGTSLPATCNPGPSVTDVFIKTNATATQQVYVCTASNTWTQQGGGVTGTVYAARAVLTSSQSIPATTETTILWDSEARDDGSIHDTSSNTDRLTAPVTGWYDIHLLVCYPSAGTGSNWREAYIKLSGSTLIGMDSASEQAFNTCLNATSLYYLTAGQWVNARTTQGSGGSLSVSTISFFAMYKVN